MVGLGSLGDCSWSCGRLDKGAWMIVVESEKLDRFKIS